jgi:FixJ family two-component response regulator
MSLLEHYQKAGHVEKRPVVYLINDDEQIRAALTAALADSSIDVIAFGTAREYRQHLRTDAIACLILDPHLADADALEFQQQLLREFGPPVVFITNRGDIECTVRVIKAGAFEVLTYPVTRTALLAAVQAAFMEDRGLRERNDRLVRLQQRFKQLTPRERQVFPLVISGLRNKQAAWRLGISEITLQIHRSQIMRKMAASSFAELVRMGDQLNIGCEAQAATPPRSFVSDDRIPA